MIKGNGAEKTACAGTLMGRSTMWWYDRTGSSWNNGAMWGWQEGRTGNTGLGRLFRIVILILMPVVYHEEFSAVNSVWYIWMLKASLWLQCGVQDHSRIIYHSLDKIAVSWVWYQKRKWEIFDTKKIKLKKTDHFGWYQNDPKFSWLCNMKSGSTYLSEVLNILK